MGAIKERIKAVKTSLQERRRPLVLSKKSLRLAFSALCLVGVFSMPEKSPRQQSADSDLEHLVFVTEDIAADIPGCDGISVFNSQKRDPLFRGKTNTSPGRLAATSNFDTILAANSNYSYDSFIYTLSRRSGPIKWIEGQITGQEITWGSGIAILKDDDTFLVSIGQASNMGQGSLRLKKFRLSEAGPGRNRRIGPEHGSIRMSSVPAKIIPLKDGHTVYAVDNQAELLTVDTRTMTESAPRLKLPPYYFGGNPVGTISQFNVHATMTQDEHYMVVNRYDIGAITLVDLQSRIAKSIPLQGVTRTRAVALNGGWINPGLLAVHAGTSVITYELHPDLAPPDIAKELDRITINQPFSLITSIGWSTSGADIIAATSKSSSDFQLIEVTDSGRNLNKSYDWVACPVPGGSNAPNDILTANGRITPAVTPTVTSTSIPTETALPTITSSATATIESSSTPAVTVTSTKIPKPIYLPIAISEQCDPQDQHADTALVIDASTSMLDATRSGRRKIDAAIDAARQFISLQDMPADQGAVVSFNRDGYLQQELTGNRNLINDSFSNITVQTQTRIDLGVKVAHEELISGRHVPDNNSVMVVLTDGFPTAPVNLAIDEANTAKADGIKIFTIGLGQAVATDMLRQMASESDDYIAAPDTEDLAGIYRQISYLIPCPPESFWPNRH